MEIVIATTNRGKFREIFSFFAKELPQIKFLSLMDFPYYPVVEEDGSTVEENATKKAVEYANFFGAPVIAEDSVLEVDVLGGAPGLFSSRYGNSDDGRMRRLLRELEGVSDENRKARFRCVTVFATPDNKRYISEGIVDGRILTAPVGNNGFGYDPVFFVDELGKSFAQALPIEKEAVSHRGKALRNIVKFVKFYLLQENIRRFRKIAVAFSGGVDSTFLLAVAKGVCEDTVAVFVDTVYLAEEQRISAQWISNYIGVDFVKLGMDQTDVVSVMANAKNRCYLCKRAMYLKMLAWCKENDYQLLDGTNFTDTHYDRPGVAALKELRVLTPMLDIGLKREEIASLSASLGIPADVVYSNTCLLTRFPRGFSPDVHFLRRIEKLEAYLKLIGFSVTRVRVHRDGICRIQVGKEEMNGILNERVIREVVEVCKNSAFGTVTLDLEGYSFGR